MLYVRLMFVGSIVPSSLMVPLLYTLRNRLMTVRLSGSSDACFSLSWFWSSFNVRPSLMDSKYCIVRVVSCCWYPLHLLMLMVLMLMVLMLMVLLLMVFSSACLGWVGLNVLSFLGCIRSLMIRWLHQRGLAGTACKDGADWIDTFVFAVCKLRIQGPYRPWQPHLLPQNPLFCDGT